MDMFVRNKTAIIHFQYHLSLQIRGNKRLLTRINMLRKYIIILTIIIPTILICTYYLVIKHPDMEWIMIDVNYSGQQADAHLIKTKNGKNILIDAGHRNTAETGLIPFLKEQSIRELDIVFISHPHIDHYGGLDYLLSNNIKIHEIYFNIPDKGICDREIPWGCNYFDVLAMHKKLKTHGTVIKIAEAGQEIELGESTRIEILYAFDGINTPVGKTDINDLSLIMMLHHNKFRFLFTGDLNNKIGTYLANSSDNISADVLKVPHHGTKGLAPNIFFEKVSPKYALVPAPKHLWLSERSARVRDWFTDNHVPTFVNGISGDIYVSIYGDQLSVNSVKRIEIK